jgi:hypothetical protein
MLPGASSAARTMLGSATKGALGGAAYGGISGFGAGEGESDRINNAIWGTALGGTVGAAAPYVGAGARSVFNYAAPRVLNKAAGLFEGGPSAEEMRGQLFPALAEKLRGTAENIETNVSLNKLAKVLQEHGYVPGQAQEELSKLGPGGLPIDLPPFRELGKVESRLPGPQGKIYEQELAAREHTFAPTIEQSAEANIAPSAGYRTEFNNQLATRSKQADEAYNAAQQGGLTPTPELLTELQNPAIQKALGAHAKIAAETGGMAPTPGTIPDARQAEAAYRVIRDKTDQLYKSGNTDAANAFKALRDRYKAALDASSPGGALPAARAQYEHNSNVLEAMQQGRSIAKTAVGEPADKLDEAFFNTLPKAHPEVQQGLLVGIHDALAGTASQSVGKARQIASQLPESTALLKRLEASIGPEKTAAVKQTMENIRHMAQTRNIVSPQSGSQSMPLFAAAANSEGGGGALETLHLGAKAAMGDTGAIAKMLGKAGAHIRGAFVNPEAQAEERLATAKFLTNPKADLEALAKFLKKQHGAYSAPVAGVTGGQVGPQAGQ